MRLLFGFAAIIASVMWGQDPRGNITGQITDSTGALIPKVSVSVANLDTNVTQVVHSNEQGRYQALFLPVGRYRVTAELTGFKTWSRPSIDVRIADRLQLDIVMELGNVAESIEVTAESPVLESTTGSIGQVLDNKVFANMPIRSGSIAWLYAMAPATVLTALPYDGPWNIAQASNVAMAGTRAGIDFNIDGVSNNSYDGQTAFVPPPDMVQEVRIDTTSYDASIGHTAGSSINVSLKQGTNDLHGTLGAFVSSGPMLTRNTFTNAFIFDPATGPITDDKIKANTPSTRWLRYSAAVGGPVYIPKLYNGRNKTFWMFGYQSHNRSRPVATQHTVPTAAQRSGDFSSLLALGSRYQLYDPFTTAPSGASRFQRQPVPRNVIPANRIDAGARGYLKYFPEPNNTGTVDGTNNYSRTRADSQDLYQPIARIDHTFSDRNRMFARYSHSDFYGHFDELISGSNARGRRRMRPHRGIAIDDVATLTPAMVLDVRYGFTWFREYESFDNMNWNLKEFGLPDSLLSQLDPRGISFPALSITGLLPLGNNGGFQRNNYSHSLLTTINWTRGSHSVKFGFDGRLMLENNLTYGNVSPALNFAETYTRGPLDNSPVAPNGQALAGFLFGIPTGGGIDLNDSRAERSGFYSGFLQDDWRVRRNLTINLGLRYEYEGPIRERFNRTSRDFDFATANPIQQQAQAAYARAPIPEVTASQFRTVGGLTFAGLNGVPVSIRNPFYGGLMPRLGFAWQAHPKMVVRGGYGLFYSLLGADFSDVSQPGFNQRTNIVSSLDNGQTYVASITNPFPSGLEKPAGSSRGLLTFLGRSPGFFAEDGRRPYSQRWSYSMQFEPMKRSVLEVGYIGSRATRLRVPANLNAIPRQYLSTSPVRDQATIDFLSARTSNPFVGLPGFEGTAFYAGAFTNRSQLIRPLPHFGDLSTGLPAGSSWYHAFTARFERRFHHGFLVLASYTWSRTMEAVAYREDTDPAPEHVLSDLDRPHRLTFSTMYEIPVGRGKRFLNGMNPVLNHAIGGWQFQAVFQMQSGPGLAFGNVIYNGTWDQLGLSNRSLQRWFNTDLFERDPQKQLANNIRTFPTRLSAVRSDGINAWDLSVHKNFRVREWFTAQLRGEAEGAMNHPNYSPPNFNPASTLFGRVTATQTGQEERRIFVGLKLIF
ncbi:MAG: carboxypeptidase regulatory-like domain-containing protein [Acidobacteria bacterium]|nr:carboxypeptidase regulatory-like domain-containing protein [Acidobacteriota bacterium]